jgi:peptide deformylase
VIFTVDLYDAFLHGECEEVDPTSPETAETVKLLLEHVQGNGVGLAAPQIGRHESIAVMQLDGGEPGDANAMTVVVNPALILLASEGLVYSVEGCLSIPEESFVVPRHQVVQLTYFDLEGHVHARELRGFPAVIAQHEIDHLQGILIRDVGKRALPHREPEASTG